MQTLIILIQMIAIIAGLMIAVAVAFYGFAWAVLTLVHFFPAIGRRHRHGRWDELTKRSGRQ